MKPHFHKVPAQMESSFSIRHDVMPNFGTTWHYHPELELHYTIKGEGVRLVGDNISNFSEGELILLGQNLPHTWHCKEEYFQNDPDKNVEAIVLQFLPNCLGNDFLQLPEVRHLSQLYEKAKRGMVIQHETRTQLTSLIRRASDSDNVDRIILLLTILKVLAETSDYKPITTANAFYRNDESEAERLNVICAYTLSNYKKTISLDEIAEISNLTTTSFCRYFKIMTKKTYYDFLTQIRISHACRHILENHFSIPQISEECGFRNIASFYRQFKKVTGITPFTYKRKYQQAKVF